IGILPDVVGTSGYHCRVLQFFPVERIEQGNERVLSLFSPSRSSESTSFRKSLRCWFGSSDRSLWNEHPVLHQPDGVRSKRYHVVPYGELDGIPVAFWKWISRKGRKTKPKTTKLSTE
ncbi:hypothetical protein Tco_0112394, partial [Tanacetum coccineum]